MASRKVITYTCDGCRNEFESHLTRPEPRYCASCAGILRKAGLGPIQTRRSTQTEGTDIRELRKQALRVTWEGAGAKRREQREERGESGTLLEMTLDEFIPRVSSLRHKYLNSPRELSKPKQAMEIEEEIRKKSNRERALGKIDIETIVYWGRGFRLLGQVRKNSDERIRKCTADAIDALDKHKPTEALEHINRIHGLQDAFGSKILAFLRPQICPVWDAVVKDCLSKANNKPKDYGEFIALCRHIMKRLEERQIENPRGTGEPWYFRDIEMALFRFAWGSNRKRTKGRYIVGELTF